MWIKDDTVSNVGVKWRCKKIYTMKPRDKNPPTTFLNSPHICVQPMCAAAIAKERNNRNNME